MSDSLSLPNSRLLAAPTQENHESSSETDEQFLRLHLIPDTTVLLPVQQLTEVLNIPIGQIVPIPHMPAWVMGIYNWRGEILWMIDLGHLCGLTSWYQQPNSISICTAVVLNVPASRATSSRSVSQALGLAVSRVEDIEWCNPDTIKRPRLSTVSPGLAPLLRGYWWKFNDEMLVILDGEAIMNAMPKSRV